MSRCDQYMGLNDWAQAKVRATQKAREVGVRILPGGVVENFDRQIEVPVAQMEVIGQIEGAWDEVVAHLHRYTLPTGEVYEEYVQATPWSSGPCYFIALRNRKGNRVPNSLWTRKAINNA